MKASILSALYEADGYVSGQQLCDKLSVSRTAVWKVMNQLKEEGYVREILSKVQNMRKDSGFEVLDRINLYVAGNEMLENVIKKFAEQIQRDTLANEIIYGAERNNYTETSINGEKLQIEVEKV